MLLTRIAGHLQPCAAAGMSDTPVVDHYGNSWAVGADAQLRATAAGAEEPTPMELPGGAAAAQFVAIDDHGFIWVAAGSQIFFCNPRATVDTETPDGSPEQTKDDPLAWTAVDAALLPAGVVTVLERSTETGSVLATFDGGETLELDVVGTDAPTPGPYTCGHGGAIVRAPSAAPQDRSWRILPARLPCGNHDIYATEAGGRVFITGGVTHHRGLPAVRNRAHPPHQSTCHPHAEAELS
eukprot:COSAG06_NODE_1070_length_10820_cov_4.675494_7_plen_239_part_00